MHEGVGPQRNVGSGAAFKRLLDRRLPTGEGGNRLGQVGADDGQVQDPLDAAPLRRLDKGDFALGLARVGRRDQRQ